MDVDHSYNKAFYDEQQCEAHSLQKTYEGRFMVKLPFGAITH